MEQVRLCPRCGKPVLESGRAWCSECRAKKNKKQKERYAKLRAQGLCTRCGSPAQENRTYCFACAVKKSERDAQWRAKHNADTSTADTSN